MEKSYWYFHLQISSGTPANTSHPFHKTSLLWMWIHNNIGAWWWTFFKGWSFRPKSSGAHYTFSVPGLLQRWLIQVGNIEHLCGSECTLIYKSICHWPSSCQWEKWIHNSKTDFFTIFMADRDQEVSIKHDCRYKPQITYIMSITLKFSPSKQSSLNNDYQMFSV